MKTTIIIEDAGAPQIAAATSAAHTTQAAAPAVPAATSGEPQDAGAAPAPDSTAAAGANGHDGGVPPAWLVDGIAAAGGMKAPLSPESIHLGADDGGAAPPA